MTPIEELKYLASLTCEACKWRISEGDTRSGLELEVEERIRLLNEQLEDQASTSTPKTRKSNKKYYDRFSETHRRVSINGVAKWYAMEDLEKVPNSKSPTGYSWRPKDMNKVADAPSKKGN